jgi:1,4-dihydroxy-6-naphthoate synthase
MKTLSLGFSPCPNDTYIFHALVHRLVPCPGIAFAERLEDVETLNQLALEGALDISKVSYHLMGHIRDRYRLLTAGGALGRGCGPLLVSRTGIAPTALAGKPVAVPGRHTTACLLLQLYNPELTDLVFMPFHEIMPAVAAGQVAAGVIIHESRFTYRTFGLECLQDLGAWWEATTGHPIPLGGIAIKRDLGSEAAAAVTTSLRASIDYARQHPAASLPYIRAHSQEMSDEVCAAHIGLYVNDYSRDLGEAGRAAVLDLFRRAEQAGLLPPDNGELFA